MSITGVGFWILVEKEKTVRDVLDVFFDPTILMCIAGVIIFILGFFGCLGALRENICLLKLVKTIKKKVNFFSTNDKLLYGQRCYMLTIKNISYIRISRKY